MSDTLQQIFKIISFYDDARWEHWENIPNNKQLINFHKDDLSDDAKLLTHWFCYVSDRQMAFQRIWDVGGFVYSELVNSFLEKKIGDWESLLDPEEDASFIRENDKKDGYEFISRQKAGKNKTLTEAYGFKEEQCTFKPRYYPSDYFSFLYTFDLLKDYGNSFTHFIAKQIEEHSEKEDCIKRLLFSLHLLTYFDVRQPRKSDLKDFKGNLKKAKKRTKEVQSILTENFDEKYGEFKRSTIYKQKRAWCSLRDFFKHPEFKECFESGLKKEGVNVEQLFAPEALQQFELPGDVWNNNSRFRRCILDGTEFESSNWQLNKILRKYFDDNKKDLGGSYPEQFDITFEFVQRMCESDNCDICPIGKLKGKGKYFDKTCIKDENKFCSVALSSCDYKVDCKGEECNLLKVVEPSP